MQRREFIGASAALGLAAMGTSGQLAWGGTATPNEPDRGSRPTDVQSEEGVVIHPFDGDVMRGNPPTKENLVTLDTYESIHGHRIWGQQHMRELCPTQIISRGTGPVSILPRKPMDVVGLCIKDLSGNTLTVQQFLLSHGHESHRQPELGCLRGAGWRSHHTMRSRSTNRRG